ncbi:uncharacterized protein [Mycetomoellerius zeteki]|uniref:uncharacterized protein n=1 Tax=Mycetomoellerius zeteki TaxID=64791 RepID=UPI00084E4419|nr:PREDICTED: uncharacterized protein LOC108720751 [Trachymyrmex zeteki]
MGIVDLKPRRTRSGAFLLEVPGGASGAEKANALAEKLTELTADNPDVRISRLERMGELRVRDLEASITKDELHVQLSEIGDCRPSEIKAGRIVSMPNGLGSVWVKCPLKAAIKITKTPRITIGWTGVRVELLADRGLQCHKCWEKVHVAAKCRSDCDRRGLCYRCGEDGHTTNNCGNDARCKICADKDAPANHRFGGRSYHPPSTPARRRIGNQAETAISVRRSQGKVTAVKSTRIEVDTAPIANKQSTTMSQDMEIGTEETSPSPFGTSEPPGSTPATAVKVSEVDNTGPPEDP